MADPIQELARLFLKFPGIGRRQAKRFVYHLLEAPEGEVKNLVDHIKHLRAEAKQCQSCYRFFLSVEKENVCDLCTNQTRDKTLLMVVEKDADLENVERLGSYRGYYFVLGGLLTSLPQEEEAHLRFKELIATLKARPQIKEVIIALNVNHEGDATLSRLEDLLLPLQSQLTVTKLGRGLSYGSELEYADPETLKNALANRKEAR